MKKTAVALLFILSITLFAAAQQDKSKRPSPPAQTKCSLQDGKTITVDYSSPRMKGRQIYGGLVPYGEVWRTGANAATGFVADTNLTVGGTNVPAGKYTIYTLPNEGNWELIINKQTGQWGTEYNQSQDLARIPMKVESLNSPVEQMTFSFEKTSADSANLVLEWEKTKLSVPIKETK